MKLCPKCKIQIEDFVEFCPVCGSNTPIYQSPAPYPQQVALPPSFYEKQRRIELKEQRRMEKERQRELRRREKMEKRMQKTQMRSTPQSQNRPGIIPPTIGKGPAIPREKKIGEVEIPKPPEPKQIQRCMICRDPMVFLKQHNKWYCQKCKRFG